MEITTEQRLELRKQHREMQAKFVYFILAINAAAIGYTVTISKGNDIHWTYLFLTVAIILWGLSFLFGTIFLMLMIAHQGTNQALLEHITDSQKEKYEKNIKQYNILAPKFLQLMLYATLGGFILFVIWHVSSIPFCEIF